jgi:hypothetical protein
MRGAFSPTINLGAQRDTIAQPHPQQVFRVAGIEDPPRSLATEKENKNAFVYLGSSLKVVIYICVD